jgi:hypothetical protein
MPKSLPRVIGLVELLKLREPLREKPAPLVYFTDKEFARLIKGATALKRRPRGAPLATFEPWPAGGMVQSKCESPPGQVCFGRWTPAGSTHGAGVYFTCICRPEKRPLPPAPGTCRLMIGPNGVFQCTGICQQAQRCHLSAWRDPASGRYVLDCRCVSGLIRA